MASTARSSLVFTSIAAHAYTILQFTLSSASSTATRFLFLGGTDPGMEAIARAQLSIDACEAPSSSATSQEEGHVERDGARLLLDGYFIPPEDSGGDPRLRQFSYWVDVHVSYWVDVHGGWWRRSTP